MMSFTSLLLSLALAMSTASTPVSLIFTIILFALFTSLTLSLHSSWLALLLFLIYVGGMLIMFSYFVATTSNQTFSPLPLFLFISLALFSTPLLLSPPISPHYILSPLLNIFMHPTLLILLCLILFLILIAVAKVASRASGPLRFFS